LTSGFTSDERRVVAASVVGTTASVFPAFLTGAVSVQLRESIGVQEGQLGLAIGAFFLGAAAGSAVLGNVAQRLGGPRAMSTGLAMTVMTGALIAGLARSALSLTFLLLIAGVSNALTQPAANLMLAERLAVERLGMALALKQSGMPMATMLGGLAVPALALTLGWQAAFLAGAALAGLALIALRERDRTSNPAPRPVIRPRPDLSNPLLVTYAVVGGLGAAAAGSLVGFLVSGAESAGVTPARAGLLLSLGSVIGVSSRLLQGRLVDRGRVLPIKQVVLLFVLGSGGMVGLSFDSPLWYTIGIVPAFGFGWAWPGLFNLSVIRNNPAAPGAATGISQTGVYIGAGAGPAAGGWIVSTSGYPALWLAGAGSLLLAAALASGLRVMVRHDRSRRLASLS
jgi:predicted MFS family arabinose efflux permease